LGYQTPATIYGADTSWQITEAGASSPERESLPHIHGRQATIIRQHNGEVGEQSAFVPMTEANSTQKT